MKKKLYFVTIMGLFLSACSSFRPILDENKKYNQVGEARAEKDIDECLDKADSYLAKHKDDKMKKQMGRQAAQGAVLGGVLGAVSGNGIQGAAGGAAIGAGVGVAGAYIDEKTKDKIKPDALKQRYVQNCLQRKNYEVIGWK
ncbi:MAG: cell envelope biogenesis protein OmpA [Deltaproteobacteria bacterium]|nr:cell envelope biogenesis protein OmpA [Deltaproteobacteria bacterium]